MAQKLRINALPTFLAAAKMVDRGDMGELIETIFKVRLKRLSSDETKTFAQRYQAGVAQAVAAGQNVNPAPELSGVLPLTDDDVITLTLAGWEGLEAEDGQAFVYNAENLATASADWPNFRPAIVRAAFKAYFGIELPEALAKNSEPQPATS